MKYILIDILVHLVHIHCNDLGLRVCLLRAVATPAILAALVYIYDLSLQTDG